MTGQQTAIGRRVILKDLQGNYLLPYTDTGSGGNPDNKTIIKTDDPLAPEMVAIGTKTRDGQYNYDWIGTQEEYQQAVADGVIQDNWMCYIIDDYGTDVQDITQLTKGCSAETMLEGRYFERPTFNPCWLLSDGTRKDGTIYNTAYSALIDELNESIAVGQVTPSGYVKRGLSVKDSNASNITDFDFVVYQDETKFRLPIATLKGCNSVSALYLYFYIGNTVTNLETVVGGAVLHSLDKKLERFDCDGQWVSKVQTLSTATAVGTYTIDLSSYLPDDNYNYEIIITLFVWRNGGSSNSYVYLKTDLLPDILEVHRKDANWMGLVVDNSSGRNASSSIILSSKQLTYMIVNNALAGTNLIARGYRRLGVNA